MQSISPDAVQINRLVIHGYSNLADEPDIAESEQQLSDGMRRFFEEHIRGCLKSSSALTAKFGSSDSTVAACTATVAARPEEFVEQCKVIGLWFAHNYKDSAQVQTFLAIALFTDEDTNERYLALLKLDLLQGFVRQESGFEQVQILPDASKQLNRFAIVRPYDDDSRYDVLYRNQAASRDEDPITSGMWLEGFLEAADVPTPRHMTQLVVRETEKWMASKDQLDDESRSALREGVRTLAQSEEMDVEAIASHALKEEALREDYVGRLLDRGLTETVFQPDKEWATKRSKKTVYICDDGVQVTGPSDVIDEVVQMLPKTEDRKTRLVIETRKFVEKLG